MTIIPAEIPVPQRRAWLEIDVPTIVVTVDKKRSFLETALAATAERFVERLPNSGPLHGKNLIRHKGSFGIPGTPWGAIAVQPADRRSQASLYAWSEDAMNRVLGGVVKDPESVECKFSTLGSHGDPGSGDGLSIAVSRSSDPRWTQFSARTTLMSATDQEWDGRLVDWGRFFVDALAALGSTTEYGFVADDQSGDQGPTALEQKLGSWPFRWADSRLLRQYAWMTYLAPSALDMVGGVRTLRETGSFEKVLELDCGGVVVVATEVPSQYDSDAVFRVFRALAPALPAGELYAPQAYVPPYKLVYEDAAVYGGKRMDAGPYV